MPAGPSCGTVSRWTAVRKQSRRFGYSRDGQPRNRQIVIGVVMMDGWPVAGKEPGVRVFVVHGDEREEYQRSMRELSMQRAACYTSAHK